MKIYFRILMVLFCILLCFTGCSNFSENKGDSSDPLPNAIFESIDEIKNLIASARESEDAFQKYREELPYSSAKLNIFHERDDVFKFESYVASVELPIVTEEARPHLNKMTIDYSSWKRIIFTCTYYIDEIRYMFSYYTNEDGKAIVIPAEQVEREVQLDDIALGLYKYEENDLCVGHTIIGEYNVQITVMTLDIDAITFEHFNLEKILE